MMPRARPARSSTLEDPSEAWVVARALRVDLDAAALARASGIPEPPVSVGDDGAVLPEGLVVTTDTMVEGVHWDARLSPSDVGFKLAAINLSDLDAMGARPQWATLALSLRAPLDRAFVDGFFRGLGEAMRRWPFRLVGGDTTRSPGPTVATLTLAGRAERPALRSGGRAGDDIWVTGELGLAAAAFGASPSREALAHLRRPAIPAPLGASLAEGGLVSAMIDLSDGLARDLGRLCRASGVGARVEPGRLPTNRPLADSVAFGEDYGLCFTAPPSRRAEIQYTAESHRVALTAIGSLTATPELLLVGHDSWPAAGFDHFSRPPIGARP